MPTISHVTQSYSTFQTPDGKPWDPCEHAILPIAEALDLLQSGWPPKTSKELERAIHGNGHLTTLEHWIETYETPAHAEKFRETVLKPVRDLEALEKKLHDHGWPGFAALEFEIDMEREWVRDGHDSAQLKYLDEIKFELVEEFNEICDTANDAAIYCRNKAALIRGRCESNPANIATRELWEKAQLDDEPQDLQILAMRCGGRNVNFGGPIRLTDLSRKILRAAEFAMDEETLKGISRQAQSSHVKYAHTGGTIRLEKGMTLARTIESKRVPVGVEQTTRIHRFCRPSVFFAWAKSKGFPVPAEWDFTSASNPKGGKSKRGRGRPNLSQKTLALYWEIRAAHTKGQSHQFTAGTVNARNKRKGAIKVTSETVRLALDYTCKYPDTNPNTTQKRGPNSMK